MRYVSSNSSNILLSLSFIVIQLSLRTNSFTVLNSNKQFKTQTSFHRQKNQQYYATIDENSVDVETTTTTPSPSTKNKDRKKSKTDELNVELSKLYHETIETGNISQVYEIEQLIFSYNANSTSTSTSDGENEETETILDTISYNTLLSTWKNMAIRYIEDTVVGSIPKDILSKNHVYVSKDIALRANKILNYMEDKNLVDILSYNIVIDTWAKSRHVDGTFEVEKLLKRMLESDNDDILPNVNTFNSILDTCSSMNKDIYNIEEKVEEIYNIMQSLQIKPNARTYNLIISAYSKSIANKIEVSRKNSAGSDNNNAKNNNNNKQNSSEKYQKQQKQKRIFDNNMIETRELQKIASQRVLEILQEIKNDQTIIVSSSLYAAAIDCLARCGLPNQCERLLEELETLFTNEKKKYEQKESSKGSSDQLYPQHVLSLSPNIRTYTSAINAWSWSKSNDNNEQQSAAFKALAILDKVDKLYNESLSNKLFDDNYSNTVKPNVRTYTAVISCISHSRMQDKAILALSVFKRLFTKYKETNDIAFKPNVFTYNAVIDTCSKVFVSNAKNPQTDGAKMQSDALKIAFDLFKLIRKDKSVKANYVTYGLLLKTTKNLLPIGEERYNIIKVLFGRCCKEGHLDNTVLKQLRQTISIEEYKELLGEDAFDSFGTLHFEKLPKSWSVNIGK